MLYSIFADIVIFVHFMFIVFVLTGGFLVLRWHKLIWLHIPAAVWGMLVEFTGWFCPLTDLENWLMLQLGQQGYAISFVERYILPIIYPAQLTRDTQFVLGMIVVIVNIVAYGLIWRQSRSGRHE